jgi:2'-5' RNA ligase superfamily
MADYRDHHATIFVPPEVAGPIEALRREWDPSMAARIAAHVTVAYPQEAPRSDLLIERVREASGKIPSFRLGLGGIGCFERPEDGVYVDVEDVDGGYARLREEVLRPPFQGGSIPPHVTLIHPRTSHRGREFWDSRGGYQRQEQRFMVEEVTITAFDGVAWVVLETFSLA